MANTFTSFIDLIYPKNSILLQADSTAPANILGGTWAQIKNGLLACAESSSIASLGTAGGSNTMTVEQMPTHNHWVSNVVLTNRGSTMIANGSYYSFDQSSRLSELTGGGQPFVPAHYAVNVWQRTS